MDAVLDRGTSETAQTTWDQITESNRHLHKSAAIGHEKVIRGELAEVWEECQYPDWDGYGALPVSIDTFNNARNFLLAMPFGQPTPSVGAEPDGCITLEWYHSRWRTLSVSITPSGEIHYAALLGPERICGSMPFVDEVGPLILDLIGKVVSC